MKTKTILIIIGSVVAAAVFAFDPPPVGSAAPKLQPAAPARTILIFCSVNGVSIIA
jgi:hypothetical protein